MVGANAFWLAMFRAKTLLRLGRKQSWQRPLNTTDTDIKLSLWPTLASLLYYDSMLVHDSSHR